MTVTELRPAEARRPADRRREPTLREDRWQPVRAGILNVWRYYDETFTFHRGRLLLRGPNGTGKSKALELLLPYLLDASLQPSRLSTFGGSERTMHWNLMGDGHAGTTRVGYVWLEFGRLDADGSPRYFTCGARLSATAHTKRVTPAYFTTSLRVGEGLSLVKDGDVPLTKADLETALEGAGTVYPTPADYRRAVHQTLLRGLTDDQYNALINAQLKLRTPKLSEHLDPEHLSRLLSDALPPLDPQDLAEIAEGFEKLDRQREDLARLDQEVAAAERLADQQRRYARRVLRRAAAELISATTRLDKLTRTARESRIAHDQAVADSDAAAQRLADLESLVAEADHRIAGLTDSEPYRQGRDLDELRERVVAARREAETARATATRRQQAATAAEEQAYAALVAAETAAGAAERAQEEAGRLALQAGLGTVFEPLRDTEPDRARREVRGMVGARERQIADVREALDAHERAVSDRRRTENLLAKRTEELERRLRELGERESQRDEAERTLRDATAAWARATRVLPLQERADELTELATDEAAMLVVVGRAAAEVREALGRDEQRLTAQRSERREEHRLRTDERDELRRATLVPPEPPPYRTAQRTGRAGAPLWRVVDWRPGVADEVQAGVEAALEAAGLLDAWLQPDGSVHLDDDGHDTYLVAALAQPTPGSSLADVLAPEADAPVASEVIGRLLAGIGYGETAPGLTAAVGADGTWRLGPAQGSWIKPEAAYVGATARERARQRRLAELEEQLTALQARIAELDADLAAISARRDALQAELDARPACDELRRAEKALDSATLRAAEQRLLVDEADQEHAAADKLATQRLRELSFTASRNALPTTRASLDELSGLLRSFGNTAEAWLTARDRWLAARQRSDDQAAMASAARDVATEATDAATSAEETASGLSARLAAVESAIGAPYQQVLDEIAGLRRHREALQGEQKSLTPRLGDLRERVGVLRHQLQSEDAQREQATGARDEAAGRFIRLGHLGFGRDARVATDIAALGSTTAALDAARAIAAELERTAYDVQNIRRAEANLSETMHGVSQHLAGHVDLAMEPDERCDVQVVTAGIDGQRVGPNDLVFRLRHERDQVRGQLTEDERHLFDRTLTGDTRRHVADRIRQADALVRDVSATLEQVRTMSALQVRIVWQIDPERGPLLAQARNLLLRDPATLTEDERDALHEFFRARIDDVRAAGTAGGWLQQLEAVLDYRTWHRFLVQMRMGGGDWVSVTRRQHGAKSGGEKAIVLHLPLFAAAAAHYRSAPEAPRLILLDEVFVGVDSTNRGQLMQVLAGFDLDLVLTSDTEWCTYPELDGIAIHQLLVDDDDDAVTTARFVWDGQRLHSADMPDD